MIIMARLYNSTPKIFQQNNQKTGLVFLLAPLCFHKIQFRKEGDIINIVYSSYLIYFNLKNKDKKQTLEDLDNLIVDSSSELK